MTEISPKISLFVLKISGKLLDQANFLLFSTIMKHYNTLNFSLLIVPGGGVKVNQLREEYRCTEVYNKETLFHWRAIELLDKNAELLFNALLKLKNKQNSKINIVMISKIEEIINNENCIYILKPFYELEKQDELEHSWSVTSDSISIYIANLVSSKLVIFIKDINYLTYKNQEIFKIKSDILKEWMMKSNYINNLRDNLGKGTIFPLDQTSPFLINKYNIPVIIMNGKDFKRICNLLILLNSKEIDISKIGTLITP